MEPTQPSIVMEFLRQNAFVGGALSGSVAAYLLGLLVSYWRREKNWRGFSVTSGMIVEKGHPDLAFTYKGRTIERLHSPAISVRNIGNRALTRQPIRVEASVNGEIVAHEVVLHRTSRASRRYRPLSSNVRFPKIVPVHHAPSRPDSADACGLSKCAERRRNINSSHSRSQCADPATNRQRYVAFSRGQELRGHCRSRHPQSCKKSTFHVGHFRRR